MTGDDKGFMTSSKLYGNKSEKRRRQIFNFNKSTTISTYLGSYSIFLFSDLVDESLTRYGGLDEIVKKTNLT